MLNAQQLFNLTNVLSATCEVLETASERGERFGAVTQLAGPPVKSRAPAAARCAGSCYYCRTSSSMAV